MDLDPKILNKIVTIMLFSHWGTLGCSRFFSDWTISSFQKLLSIYFYHIVSTKKKHGRVQDLSLGLFAVLDLEKSSESGSDLQPGMFSDWVV